jgi:DNA-binding response OmpR family regulator
MAEGRDRVLVVDDDDGIVRMIELALKRDFEVTTCMDGATALEKFEAGEFEAVVADHMMPGPPRACS